MTHSKKIIFSLVRILSSVLHPFFISVYGIILIFLYTDFKYIFSGQFFRFFLPILIFTALVPMNILFLMKYTGLIKNYALTDRRERFLPLLGTFSSYLLVFFYFYRAGLYIWFLSLYFAACLLLIALIIITSRWKISTHMASIGGLLGGLMAISYFVKGNNPYVLFIILFILAGCLGTARLIMGKHTPAQIYTGFLLGFFIFGTCVFLGSNYAYIYYLMRHFFM